MNQSLPIEEVQAMILVVDELKRIIINVGLSLHAALLMNQQVKQNTLPYMNLAVYVSRKSRLPQGPNLTFF